MAGSIVAQGASSCDSVDGGDPGAFAEVNIGDTTGATVLLIFSGNFGGGPSVSDNKGNTWEYITPGASVHGVKNGLWKAASPIITGPGHTFRTTIAGSSGFPSVNAIALAGVANELAPDTGSTGYGGFAHKVKGNVSGLSLTFGSVQAALDGVMWIACMNYTQKTTSPIVTSPAGFTVINDQPANAQGRGTTAAYLNQLTSAALTGVGWTVSPSGALSGHLIGLGFGTEEEVEAPVVPSEDAVFVEGHGRVLAWMETFHKDEAGNDYTYRWGTHELWDNPDEATVLLRFRKEARLIAVSYTDRSLSGPTGEFRAGTCTVRFSDIGYKLRGWLDNAQQYGVLNVEAIVWIISEEDWRARLNPMKYFHGKIARYLMEPNRVAAVELKDVFGLPLEQELPLPQLKADFSEVLSVNVAPDADAETVGPDAEKFAPLAMGEWNGDGSEGDTPVFVEDDHDGSNGGAANGGGGAFSPANPFNTFGDIAGTPAPTGLSLSEDLGGGNLMLTSGALPPGSAWQDEWCVQVTRVRSGVESDPLPFDPGDEFIVITADNSAIDASCSNAGHVAGDVYRFYLGTQPVTGGRPLFSHFIQTSNPVTGVKFTDKVLTPGGVSTSGPTGNQRYWAAASWVYADGETPAVPLNAGGIPLAFIMSPGYHRPVRFALTPPTGATGGFMYLSELPWFAGVPVLRFPINVGNLNTNGDVVWEWDMVSVDYTVVDEIARPKGLLPTIPLGNTFTDDDGFSGFAAFLVTYGVPEEYISFYQPAVAGEKSVKVSESKYGSTWFIPGKTGYSTRFSSPYVTRNGRRYSVIYVLGVDGTDAISGDRPITVNLRGIQHVNDAGSTMIESGFDQLAWLLDNWWLPAAAQPRVGGDWNQDVPEFGDGTLKRDVTSFDTTAVEHEATIGDQSRSLYIEATETPRTGLDLLRDVLIGLDVGFGPNLKGQAVVRLLPPIPSDAVASASIDHVNDILDDTFEVEDDSSIRASRVKYEFRLNPAEGEYDSRDTLDDVTTQLAYHDEIVPVMELQYPTVRSVAVAANLGARALQRLKRPERTVRIPRPFFAIHQDLGLRLLVTHPDGPALDGYVNRFLEIHRVTPDHDLLRLTAWCWDLDWIGPATLLPALPGTGGDGDGAGEGTPPSEDLLEALMAENLNFGGSRINSAVDGENTASEANLTGEIVPYDHRTVLIPWSILPGWTATVRVGLKVATGSVTPRIRNLTDATDDAVGSTHSTTTLTIYEFDLPAPDPRTDKRYALLLDESGNTALDIFAFGSVRLEPA